MNRATPTLRRALQTTVAAASGLAMIAISGVFGGSPSTGARPAESFAAAAFTTKLAGVCPNPLIVQTNWLAEADHAGLYELIGGGGMMKQYSYEGPLGSTGIKLQILAAGPGDANLSAEATMYSGNPVAGVTPQLGIDSTEGIIQTSKKFPTVGVMNLQDHDPQIFLYSPSTFKNLNTISSLKAAVKSGAKFYVSSNTIPYVQYLISKGVPQSSFIGGYAGDLEKFVTGQGKIINQGYADAEPWILAHQISAWGSKPLKYTLIYKYGLDDYPTTLIVAKGQEQKLTPCLRKFVPLVQQGLIDYFKNPTTVDNVLAKINPKYSASYWQTPVAESKFSAQAQLKEGIAENSSADGGSLGAFNLKRVRQNIKILLPIYKSQSPGTYNPSVTPAEIVTNKFIDPKLRLAK
ncbi:MAG: hypothetical protein J2P57_04285 [Acidimicrobiaceae bacterium]|nr:hypothetical protein [Acidimicrobiaceae bacterium]